MSLAKKKFLIELVPSEVRPRLGKRTIKILETTKTPIYAFVAYEIPKLLHDSGLSESEVTTGLVVVNVEDQPSQEYNLNDLINRGGKYICHANFPRHDHEVADRVKKWKLYDDPNQGNPWDNLHRHCLNQLGQSVEIHNEVRKYKQEVESLKRELEKSNKETAIK